MKRTIVSSQHRIPPPLMSIRCLQENHRSGGFLLESPQLHACSWKNTNVLTERCTYFSPASLIGTLGSKLDGHLRPHPVPLSLHRNETWTFLTKMAQAVCLKGHWRCWCLSWWVDLIWHWDVIPLADIFSLACSQRILCQGGQAVVIAITQVGSGGSDNTTLLDELILMKIVNTPYHSVSWDSPVAQSCWKVMKVAILCCEFLPVVLPPSHLSLLPTAQRSSDHKKHNTDFTWQP